MKKAFSLVELLVVIAIIAVLASILLGTFTGGTDSARCARCLSNLRNLASACHSYGIAEDHYPCAGSCEYMKFSGSSASSLIYREVQGWIGWNSNGAYDNRPSDSVANSEWYVSTYSTGGNANDKCWNCVTNGVVWPYVSGNHDVYKCPLHVSKYSDKATPYWSYVMNAYFGWTGNGGEDAGSCREDCGIGFRGLHRADRVLLFAELPFMTITTPNVDQVVADIDATGEACDCILQYKFPTEKGISKGCNTKEGTETIGFNHRVGKNVYANVVFADGHVEKLACPKAGMSNAELQNLTTWLCSGLDVSFNGSKYERVTSNSDGD